MIARRQQLHEITQAIMEVDNKAFISVCSAMSVYGNGFETVKGKRLKPVPQTKNTDVKITKE